ncbi:MAG TPA: aspartyl/asparaginyl beta-hydroxylase domain-containing protein [Candidatus Tumulicola sp.]
MEPGMTDVLDAPLPARFSSYIAQLRQDADGSQMLRYPGLTSQPWHDPAQFPLVSALESAAKQIAGEAAAIDAHTFHRETEPIPRTGSWDVFFLYDRGRRHEANCQACPVTAQIIEKHRTVRDLAGLAYFSRMAPRTRVASHHGPTNMRLRCHLGIDVPPDCGLIVAGEARSWSVGKCLVFDDSFPHEVWNDSAFPRTILVVDLWHPDLSEDEVRLLRGLQRYAAGHGAQAARSWALNAQAESKVHPPRP